jgi:hypothetical protein
MKTLTLFVVLFLAAYDCNADCLCVCVNGTVRPICTSPLDFKPLCTPAACPIGPTGPDGFTPIQVRDEPRCYMQSDYDPATARIVWHQVCS